jgi:hypothetical protein
MALSSVDISTEVTDGGFVWLTQNGASMRVRKIGDANDLGGVHVSNGGVELKAQPSAGTEISLSLGNLFAGVLYARGQLAGGANHADAMFFGGQGTVGAGFGAIAIGYGLTMTGPRVTPTYSIQGAGPTFMHCMSSPTLSGFTIAWNDGAAHSYFWRAVRD